MATTLFFYWASWRAVVAVGRMRPRMQAYIKGQGLYGPCLFDGLWGVIKLTVYPATQGRPRPSGLAVLAHPR